MHVSELLDEDLLADYISQGYISARRNNDDDLTIYNYTPKTQYANLWDDVTRVCRGLIVDHDGEVIARPFPKFFNYGDTDNYDEVITPDTEVTAYDKLDGSLGIVYWDKQGQPQVATRGSFHSVMAEHASALIKDMLVPNFSNITILVEIIYPENQIVVDYKGMDRLVMLGGIHIPTGEFFSPEEMLVEMRGVYPHGGITPLAMDYHEIHTVEDALNNLNRENREGYVLHTQEGTMVKVKQEDYMAMHHAVFNFSKRTLWFGFAHDVLTKIGKPFDEVVTSSIKLHLNDIKDSGGTEKLTKKLVPLLPKNLHGSVEHTIEEFTGQLQEQIRVVLEFLEATADSDMERRYLYELAVEKLGKGLAGSAIKIAMAEDSDEQDRAFDQLVMTVVSSIMPKKGDRLTEALTEEDE